MDSDVTLRHQTASPSSAPTSPTSAKKAPNGSVPAPTAPPSSDDSDLDIEDDLISAIQHKADDEEVVCGGFLQRYFSNHSNSLPSRLAVASRRLSQCREEDEEEERLRDQVPSSNMSTISGSDKSLSESSTGSKTSVIDTVTGPTHKFVIVKTKSADARNDLSPTGDRTSGAGDAGEESGTGSERSVDAKKGGTGYTDTRKLSEAAKIFASRRQYRQANTVHGVPSQEESRRPTADSIFVRSPLQSPHYDTKFFDSSLVEIKSRTSSSSTVDNCGSAEDIWVRRNRKEIERRSRVNFEVRCRQI
ncbi:unnamed protein product [Callosobruchus maculatus]|uniref:Uncharacterized protein n=2 Tax=Callosobruchus maculatus TaxID=64391 RepID=A0A653CVH8_CALMS|nr:unnamed protein product [Callosobruchus maculatus]